jgi:hypothetical protein
MDTLYSYIYYTMDYIRDETSEQVYTKLDTAGCNSARFLDSNDVHLVEQIGLQTSRLDLIQ